MEVNIEHFHNWFQSQKFDEVIAIDWVEDIRGLVVSRIKSVIANPGTENEIEINLDNFIQDYINTL